MRRFQVRDGHREWGENGPDLLRPDANALKQLDGLYPKDEGDIYHRVAEEPGIWGQWSGPWNHGKTQTKVGEWMEAPAYDLQALQIKVHPGGDVTAAVKAHKITVQNYSNATDRAEQAWAMYDRIWPGTTFAGIFVCKPYSHGFGDAVDVSYGNTAKVFDWGLRMAKNELLVCEQIIGTQNGTTEVQAWRSEGYAVRPYNGNDSHCWHVHHGCGHATDGSPPCM